MCPRSFIHVELQCHKTADDIEELKDEIKKNKKDESNFKLSVLTKVMLIIFYIF